MIFVGQAVQVQRLNDGVAELRFDFREASVNKLNQLTLKELREAIAIIAADKGVRGVMVTSGKKDFIVGADIREFGEIFKRPEDAFIAELLHVNITIFNALEDLPVPTVAVINGLALGGGLEVALAADFRVMSRAARIGLPETSLGIIPGYGGTIRLPRLIGADNAIEWIVGGTQYGAEAALKFGVADAIVAQEQLHEAAFSLLQLCLAGKLDYLRKRREKLEPLILSENEIRLMVETCSAVMDGQVTRPNQAPRAAVDTIMRTALLRRDEALPLEAAANAKLARSPVAKNLIGGVMGNQILLKEAKALAKSAKPVLGAAVLGSGIMGGGIAYQSALKGIPVIIKDISPAKVEAGRAEVAKLLSRQVERGDITPSDMAATLNRIVPSRTYEVFAELDLVVEAVAENADLKKAVLAEAEAHLNEHAVLASNTSTISITYLSSALHRPDRFCGMHFFNPVYRMELVEVIRGKHTADHAVARAVGYALSLGKKPVVVKDCPGFLVNRVLAPYLNAFLRLVNNGVNLSRIDKIMERFGWPMGPAQLCDVIGLDTLVQGDTWLAEAYPDRLSQDFFSSHETLVAAGRLGQKNGRGYYAYQTGDRGRLIRTADPEVARLLAPAEENALDIDDTDIVEQLMMPLCLEAVRCLEEGIVASPNGIDMALVHGLGFPAFRGGPLRYLDDFGLNAAVDAADRHVGLGGGYRVPETLRQMAATSARFYS